MKLNIRQDVIDSYDKLINDCEMNIEKGFQIETNELMMIEYKRVLNEVKRKTEKDYDELAVSINKIYQYSVKVHDLLAQIRPYKEIDSNVLHPKVMGVKV